MNDLDPKQLDLLEHMRQHPFPLTRLRRGHWTTTDCQPLDGTHPDKWWGTRIVAELLERGFIYNETAKSFRCGRFKLRNINQ